MPLPLPRGRTVTGTVWQSGRLEAAAQRQSQWLRRVYPSDTGKLMMSERYWPHDGSIIARRQRASFDHSTVALAGSGSSGGRANFVVTVADLRSHRSWLSSELRILKLRTFAPT